MPAILRCKHSDPWCYVYRSYRLIYDVCEDSLQREALCLRELDTSRSFTRTSKDVLVYDMVITTYPRKNQCLYLLQTLASAMVAQARPRRLTIVSGTANSLNCEGFQHLSHQVVSIPQHLIRKLEKRGRSPGANSNYWLALSQYKCAPLLVVEDDIIFGSHFDAQLQLAVQKVRSESFLLSLYKGDFDYTKELKAVDSVVTSMRSSRPWSWGTQAILFSGERFIHNLTSWIWEKDVEDTFVGLQDMIILAYVHELEKNHGTIMRHTSRRSLVQHVGFHSSIFGENSKKKVNSRFHIARDFI